MKRDYGTATPEEISAGFKLATTIADMIQSVPNPAVQNMVKQLISLIAIRDSHA